MNEELVVIARRLGFATLEIRNSDRLDFHEVAVWQVREALEAAYEAGKQAARDEMGEQATGTACSIPDERRRPR